jgi:glycosyltransferase involved in cell wall biosynthesis
VREGRDIFVIIKFMDEAPHIRATLQSLINQKQVDLRRVVIVAVDNNSTDGSDQIVKDVAATNRTAARIIYTNQPTPGGGSAARFGVDRSIATLYHMCLHDARWERLQTGLIAVSDGDTVYHPHVLCELVRIFDHDPTVDGVMPFLVYKYTGALRLFSTYIPSFPEELCLHAHLDCAIPFFGKALPVSDEDLRPLSAAERLDYVLEQARAVDILPPDIGARQIGHYLDVLRANTQAMQDYTPRVYPGRVIVFRADEQPAGDHDPSLGWSGLAAEGLEVYSIPGNHSTMVREPHVQALAERLNACLDNVRVVVGAS